MDTQEKIEERKSISKHDFYFETPLYELVSYSDLEDSKQLLSGDIDAYSAMNSTDTESEIERTILV